MTKRSPSGSEAGFSLIEMGMVIAIMGALTAVLSTGASGFVENKRSDTLKVKMETVEEAIIRYAAAARRLPCPASATATANAAIGVEDVSGGTCTANQNDGIVPWVTLGLPREAALDPWGRYITMRVAPELTDAGGAANSLAAATTLPALLAAVDGRGLMVAELTATNTLRPIMRPNGGAAATGATDPTSGAAYVLISHGKDGLGGYTTAGRIADLATGNQAGNNNNTAVHANTEPYVMGSPRPGFDDVVSAMTISQLAVKAGLVN